MVKLYSLVFEVYALFSHVSLDVRTDGWMEKQSHREDPLLKIAIQQELLLSIQDQMINKYFNYDALTF